MNSYQNFFFLFFVMALTSQNENSLIISELETKAPNPIQEAIVQEQQAEPVNDDDLINRIIELEKENLQLKGEVVEWEGKYSILEETNKNEETNKSSIKKDRQIADLKENLLFVRSNEMALKQSINLVFMEVDDINRLVKEIKCLEEESEGEQVSIEIKDHGFDKSNVNHLASLLILIKKDLRGVKEFIIKKTKKEEGLTNKEVSIDVDKSIGEEDSINEDESISEEDFINEDESISEEDPINEDESISEEEESVSDNGRISNEDNNETEIHAINEPIPEVLLIGQTNR